MSAQDSPISAHDVLLLQMPSVHDPAQHRVLPQLCPSAAQASGAKQVPKLHLSSQHSSLSLQLFPALKQSLGALPSEDGSGGRGAGAGGDSAGSGGDNGDGPDEACSGSFANPKVILSGGRVTSPALSDNNLELFYVAGESYYESFMVSRRASMDEPFPAGTPLDELNEFDPCVGLNKTIDVSPDGLRAYVSCYIEVDTHPQLYQFERPDRDSPFADPIELGLAFASTGISPDGLTLVGSRFESDVATFSSTRAALDQPFPAPQPLPGLENESLFGPTLSRDGLELYGALGSEKLFSVARRADVDSPFGAPASLAHLTGGLWTAGAPDLSDDCRIVVYVGVDPEYNWGFIQVQR